MRQKARFYDPEDWKALTTRIPKTLAHQMRVYTVEHETHLRLFVIAALEEKLRKERRRA